MSTSKNYLEQELYDLIKKDDSIFTFLQEGSLDGIWFWDLEKVENEWMSPKFWTNFGYDPAEKKHLSSEWQDMIFPEDIKTATENFKKHCEDPNYPYDQVVRYRKKDGSTSWIRCRGIAIRDKNGKPLRMLGAHNDITAIKEAEMTSRNLIEKMLSAFALHEIILDEKGIPVDYKFIDINPEFEKSTGLKRENIIGKNVTEVIPGIEKDPVDWIGKYGKVALTGEPIKFENYSKEIDKWYAVSAYSPKKNFFATIFNDVTETKKYSQVLQDKIEEFERINTLTVNRELKMVELKQEIDILLEELGREPKYKR